MFLESEINLSTFQPFMSEIPYTTFLGQAHVKAHKLLQVARGGGIGEQVQHADVDGGYRAGQGGQIGQAGG